MHAKSWHWSSPKKRSARRSWSQKVCHFQARHTCTNEAVEENFLFKKHMDSKAINKIHPLQWNFCHKEICGGFGLQDKAFHSKTCVAPQPSEHARNRAMQTTEIILWWEHTWADWRRYHLSQRRCSAGVQHMRHWASLCMSQKSHCPWEGWLCAALDSLGFQCCSNAWGWSWGSWQGACMTIEQSMISALRPCVHERMS